MKTIVYIILSIFIIDLASSCHRNYGSGKQIILIQSVGKVSSIQELYRSANIISSRLNDFTQIKNCVTVIPDKNQIQLEVSRNCDISKIESLVIQKGKLEVYETFDKEAIKLMLKKDNRLFLLLSRIDTLSLGARIGYGSYVQIPKINDYLKTTNFDQFCKFAWSEPSEKSECSLFALHLDSAKGAVLNGSEMDHIRVIQLGSTKNYNMEIKFNKRANLQWLNLTKHNINKVLAITLDNIVICAPVVRSVISNGSCVLSGSYVQTEALYFAAMANNGTLPLNFNVIH